MTNSWTDSLKPGDMIASKDTVRNWLYAVILKINENNCFIHYIGWPNKWDIWVNILSPTIKQINDVVTTTHNITYIFNHILNNYVCFEVCPIYGHNSHKTVHNIDITTTCYKSIVNDENIYFYKDLRKLIIEFLPKRHIKFQIITRSHKYDTPNGTVLVENFFKRTMPVNVCLDEFFNDQSLYHFKQIAQMMLDSDKKN